MDVALGRFIDVEELRRQYRQFLIDHNLYFFDIDSFPDLIEHCYLMERYIGVYEINGEEYDVHSCWAEYREVGVAASGFSFYLCYLSEDVPELPTLSDYKNARKIYRTEKLDPDDFPIWMDLTGDFIESGEENRKAY